ncbi:MAG: hypothetical protein EXS55_02725 [Candidatus Magasanikbacteria bacterium]|nr:hypothetical protein [Candidatus Magasanikbacteria bacterium]
MLDREKTLRVATYLIKMGYALIVLLIIGAIRVATGTLMLGEVALLLLAGVIIILSFILGFILTLIVFIKNYSGKNSPLRHRARSFMFWSIPGMLVLTGFLVLGWLAARAIINTMIAFN